MYICYVDESGHCGEKRNPKQPVEVLCGVVCDLTKLAKTQREHHGLLRELQVDELKASDAYRGRKDWSGVAPQERDRLFDHLAGWAEERKCKLLVSPIDADRFFTRKENGCSLCNALGSPWEAGALHILLGLQRHQQGRSKNKGKTIVIFDEQRKHDERLLAILESDIAFTDAYTGFKPRPKRKHPPQRLDQIVDVPHFSKSHLAAVIQVADWAAFVVGKMLNMRAYGVPEAYAGERTKLEGWYRALESMSVSHTAMQRRSKDPLSTLYRDEICPPGWSWNPWL